MPYLFEDETDADERRAILITPADHPLYWVDNPEKLQPELVEHQYGCVGCSYFAIQGRVTEIADTKLAAELANELGGSCCMGGLSDPAVLSKILGEPIAEIVDEALAKLADGRYLAVLNCD